MTSVAVADLTVTTASSKALLEGISLNFRPGKLTAIIAPTGAGKSTLLNTIAGRCSLKISGQILLGDKQVQPRNSRERFGYVAATDSLFGTLTPREAFLFAYKLGNVKAPGELKTQVSALLEKLKLTHCADTLIGNASVKGLSSGERKRVAVGLEMINEPEIFLLDEPTSGLDSYSAQLLVELLRTLAAGNTTVIATIHQPSSKLFSLFDDVIFLFNGKVGYSGPVSYLSEFFSASGHPCADDYNPADHAMFLLQTLDDGVWRAIAKHSPGIQLAKTDPDAVKAKQTQRQRRSGFFQQLGQLTLREARNFIRDKEAMQARLTVSILLTVIISLVYWKVGDKTTNAAVSYSHVGAITLVAVNCMFANSQLLLLSFPQERPVFIREYSSGLYSSFAYAVSKWLVEWPVLFAQICLQVVIAYFIMQLKGSYLGLVYACFLITVASSSVALLVSAVATDARQALEAAPIIFVPQIYYTGFFLESIDQMPAILRWGRYLCSLRYGLNIAILSEFKGFVPGKHELYNRFDISPDSEWWYALVLVIITLVFRVFTILMLRLRAFWDN